MPELNLSVSARFTATDSTAEDIGFGSATFNTTGDQVAGDIIKATTTPTALPIGGIVTLKLVTGKNLDTAASISLRNGSGGSNFSTIPPGGVLMHWPSSGQVIYIVSSSGTPEFQYKAFEA